MSNYVSVLSLNDQFSRPLQNIVRAMHTTLSVMQQLNSASARDMKLSSTIAMAKGEIISANNAIQRMTQNINQTNSSINNISNSQRQFNNEARKSHGIFSDLKGMVGGLMGLYAVKQTTDTLDNISNIGARLNLVNDGSQTQAELQQKIYQAAQASRGEYTTLASSVGKLGILAKDAFKTNDEAIIFAQQMNKQFKIGGASIQEQQSAMYQLTQAMAAGKLQGDEFRSIMENAPLLAQAIAKEMGVTQGQLKEMGSEGKITADVIKKAMINSAEETNKKFAEIPMTFGDIANSIKNKMIMSLIPIQQTITNLMNSSDGMALINTLGNTLGFLVSVLNGLLNVIIQIGLFIQSNWSVLEPILLIIGTILTLWALTLLPNLILKLSVMVSLIYAQAAAWMVANAPLLIIVTIIVLLIYCMLKFASVAGFVGGVFGVLFAFLYNKFALFANIVLSVAEFVANVFIDPVYAVKKLFYDMSITVLSYITNIAKGIERILNSIPGVQVNISAGMSNLLGTLESARDNLKSGEDVVSLMRFNQMDYGDAFNKGQDFGLKAREYAIGGLKNIADMFTNKFDNKMDNFLGNQDNLFGKGNSQIGSIKDDVNINEEDIKLLRDIAERDAINKISTLSPNITVTFGDVKETADVEKVAGRIKEMLVEQIAVAAEGVHI